MGWEPAQELGTTSVLKPPRKLASQPLRNHTRFLVYAQVLTVSILALGPERSALAQEAEFVGVTPHKLLSPAPADEQHFGAQVAAEDDTVVVTTSPGVASTPNYAVAYVFRKDEGGPSNWGLAQTLTPRAPSISRSGSLSVAMDDDWLLLGADREEWRDASGTRHGGAVYLYRLDARGGYGLERRITHGSTGRGEQFGFSVASDGRFLLVGSSNAVVDGRARGAVYVYERDAPSPGGWGFVQRLTPATATGARRVGSGVAVSGEYAAVGAPGDGPAGSAYVFRWDDTAGRFSQVQRIEPSYTCAPSWTCSFGFKLALYKLDLFIGASGAYGPGAVEHYVGDASGRFGLARTLRGSTADGALFGHWVGYAPGLLLTGAHGENASGGAAYLFYQHHPTRGTGWGQVARLESDSPTRPTRFGTSVAVDHRVAAVGAYFDSELQPEAGSAFVYELGFAYTPEFTSIPLREARVSETYRYVAEVRDGDEGDMLTLSAPTLPGWLTLTDHGDGTATLSGTPSTEQRGSHDVVLEVRDGTGRTATQSFNVVVRESTGSTATSRLPPSPNCACRALGGSSTRLPEALALIFGLVVLTRLRRRL